ncbi:MAG: protocatechuate 3,4-dioxygenase [Burkholderiales bacterium]|nr:protocatechuate 3,4-dioxygenase [Burkholderiales bacterium]
MAQIVLGLGSSHGPMLATPPAQWDLRAGADRNNPRHAYRGALIDFATLKARRDKDFTGEAALPEREARFARCQRALDRLAQAFRAAAPDVAVIVGNDQREVFQDDFTGAFTVYTGETIANVPLDEARRARLPPGIAIAEAGHCPPEGATYPGAPDLARSMVRSLTGAGFDVAQSARLPKGEDRQQGIPHAFGFIYRRIMQDQPPRTVPVFVNGGVPDNIPSAARCLAFGRALAGAIAAWPNDLRVVLVASGGWTHFVVDEELDARFLQGFRNHDETLLAGVEENLFLGNTSEMKNWYPVASAMHAAGKRFDLIDYVPCYRTEAGTGNAMGFARWQ